MSRRAACAEATNAVRDLSQTCSGRHKTAQIAAIPVKSFWGKRLLFALVRSRACARGKATLHPTGMPDARAAAE
jgi:hypothetical protein